MAVPTDPSALAAAASCYDCTIPAGQQLAVQIYLLNSMLAVPLTPEQLAANASCYDEFIPDGMKRAAIIYLLLQLANA